MFRGERTASALESRLNDVESRIDKLLASVEDANVQHDLAPAGEKSTAEDCLDHGRHETELLPSLRR